MWTMASLIMSAAVPWMGVLMAVRSAALRTVALALAMSRSGRRRPVRVLTQPRDLASAMVWSM